VLTIFEYANGIGPNGTLAQGFDGNFYNTTNFGWPRTVGTVFKVTPAGGIGFHNQSVLNDNYVQITANWTITNLSSGLTPQCGYGGSAPKQVILKY
jgi:hypothetical protein